MTINEKFAVLQNEYTHLMGEYMMMKADYKNNLRDEKVIMLDKIKNEILQIVSQEQSHDERWALGLRYAVNIINKYKAESEE